MSPEHKYFEAQDIVQAIKNAAGDQKTVHAILHEQCIFECFVEGEHPEGLNIIFKFSYCCDDKVFFKRILKNYQLLKHIKPEVISHIFMRVLEFQDLHTLKKLIKTPLVMMNVAVPDKQDAINFCEQAASSDKLGVDDRKMAGALRVAFLEEL